MGERRELNPRMVDSQSTALIHLATSALLQYLFIYFFSFFLSLTISNRNFIQIKISKISISTIHHLFCILFLRYDIYRKFQALSFILMVKTWQKIGKNFFFFTFLFDKLIKIINNFLLVHNGRIILNLIQ